MQINIPQETLNDMYLVKKLSLEEISCIFKCNPETVRKRLHQYGIKPRQKFHKALEIKRTDITKEVLEHDYMVNKLTQEEIATKYRCGPTLISNLMKEYGIHSDRISRLVGREFSIQHRMGISSSKIKKNRTGPSNHKWKGGVSSDHTAIRRSAVYVRFRNQVLRIRGEKCELCGVSLLVHCPTCNHRPDRHVHHIKPFSDNEALRFDPTNVLVLCHSCHNNQHS